MALWALLVPWLAQAATSAPLRVVTDDNYPPYLFKGADGQAQGYLVDLWALWERKTGTPVALTATNWARAQQMVQTGEADVIDMIFRTADREPLYSFSKPYADVPVALYAHRSISGIQSVTALSGFRVGVQAGDACIEYLRAQGITDVVTYPNYQRMLDAAVGQQIKLFCMDQYPGDHYLYLNQLHKDYVKAFDLYVGQFHRAVRRGQQPILDRVEAGMAQITPAERDALQKKWLQAPFDWYEALLQSSLVLLVLLLMGGVLLFWVHSLRRAVRQRTDELSRERARLTAVIRAIPDLVWLKDPQGVYLGCNRAFEGLYGVPEADILGKTDRDFVDEATAQSFRHHDQKAMAADHPSVNEEWLTFAEDGRRRLFETVKTAMRDGQGLLIGVLGVARDITERKRESQELDRLRHRQEDLVKERTAQLQRLTESLRLVVAEQAALFAAAPVGIVVLRNRQIESCNPRLEAIFGVASGAMIGQSTRTWYLDDADFDQMGRIYPSLMAGERSDKTVLMRRHNGEMFWAHVHAQAIDASDPDKGVMAVIEDATREHEASEALRLAQAQADMATRLKSAFLANISHEVRTPLNAILGMSHLALEADSDAERRDYLKHVQQAGQHLLRLFNDLLELSRFEAGKLQLSATVFELKGALDALLQLQASRAAERGLGLRLVLAPEVPVQLVGDVRRLSQLLLVYLDNAFKFTKQGEVALQVQVLQQAAGRVRLRFEVRDTGPGMSATEQQVLFRLFQQGDPSLSRPHGGLGIGLAMAAQIANLMDGEVGVDSAPGKGSTFWFSVWLGLAQDEEAHSHRLLRVPGRRALVASGDAALREHLMPLLRGFGLTVEAAASGPEVVRWVHRATQIGQAFDFVFLDAVLPEVDGWQTARMLQALELPRPLKVIMLGPDGLPEKAAAPLVGGVLAPQASASTVWDAMATCLAQEEPAMPRLPEPPSDTQQVAIDVAAGLKLCDGKPEVYHQLLQQFEEVHQQTLAQLKSNDLATVLRAVHLLKGQAEALGAHRLHALSAGLEQHLSAPTAASEDWVHDPALTELVSEVEQVSAQLTSVQIGLVAGRRQTAREPMDALPAGGEDGLAALEQALVDGDVEALTLVNVHQALLQRVLGEQMAELRQALTRYDFDAALAVLRKVLSARS